MTLSEKICQDINRKFYFDDFVLTNLYYYKDRVKMEICDGLIEFEGVYVLIQIKEQSKNCDTYKWLNKKVYKKAVEQIKQSIDIIQNMQNITVEDMYGQKVKLVPNKQILPLIIFKAVEPINYRKVYHSNTKNININIFSMNDYEIMLNTLLMPIDIINYLSLRKEAFEHGNYNILIDESEEYWTSLANIENEKDIAEYFLFKTIKNKPIDIGSVIDFLGLIQKYHSRRTENNPHYKEILNVLLRFDRFGAKYFMQRWIKMWQNAKSKVFNFTSHMVAQNEFEKFGILFISIGNKSEQNEIGYYTFLGNLFIQQYELTTAILIISKYEEDGNFSVNWIYMSKPYTEDKELKKYLKEHNPWEYVIKLK